MVAIKAASIATTAVSLLASSVIADIDPIVIKGSKFFFKTNQTEFFIKGIAYQQAVGANGASIDDSNIQDPLTDTTGCKRDIPLLQQLQTNTIRVYSIDTTKSHDDCMTMLQNAGIYVIADMSAPNVSINRDDPSWDVGLYARYTNVIDTMQKYPNTLGFFAGNEVANMANNSNSLAFVKAAVRDSKAYIKQKNYRAIGVGYAADDNSDTRVPVRDYINCGDASDSIDFFGYNIYSWCGPLSAKTNSQTTGYDERTQELSTYNVPAFFAEYGCNTVPPSRPFDETIVLYGKNMTDVWSGGIVFEYFQGVNKFGLVSPISDGDTTASPLPDFTHLSSQIAKVTPTGVNMGSYSPSNSPQACPPTTNTTFWAASSNLPPTPNEQVCGCMAKNLTCTAKSSVSTDDFEDLFNAACKGVDCDGINANGTTGQYGAYSMCSAADKLAFAFNAYVQKNGLGPNNQNCDFSGNAQKQSATVSDQCSALLSQAGSAGTGVVTSMPSGTNAIGGAASSSTGAAALITIPDFDFGLLKMGTYVTVAVMAGAGMILL